MRYDIVSDTHGRISDELLAELEGADILVHAGDMCSLQDFERLSEIAPLKMCLGNNDYGFDYGPFVTRMCRFFSEGQRFQVCHYVERLDLETCDIAICGHTHKPFIEHDKRTGTLVMNPGSASLPRNGIPTIGRIIIEDKQVTSVDIIEIDDPIWRDRYGFFR